jgi:hypothetical protein
MRRKGSYEEISCYVSKIDRGCLQKPVQRLARRRFFFTYEIIVTNVKSHPHPVTRPFLFIGSQGIVEILYRILFSPYADNRRIFNGRVSALATAVGLSVSVILCNSGIVISISTSEIRLIDFLMGS